MAAERLFLGVDGGGTRCRARLCTADGTLLGQGSGGPANIRLGMETAWTSITQAVDAALFAAELDRQTLTRVTAGLGLAGVTNEATAIATQAACPLPLANLQVAGDTHIACMGAFGGDDGAILIAGTGSAGYALIKGVGITIGGWGFEVSDDGSGAAIGRESIRATLRAHDGMGPRSAFTDQVIERLGGTPHAIVTWVGTARPTDYAALAPLTLMAARSGDPVAASIIALAASHLADHVRRLMALGAPALCLSGGVGEAIRDWLPPWATARLTIPVGDAMDGAILMARHTIGQA